MKTISYGRQSISENDVQAVIEVLRSDWLTQGPAVERFERGIADYCGAPFATAVCNASAGLHLAYLSLGLGPGDRLWTSPNTFVSTANAALLCGAEVDFVDIDPGTLNLSVAALERKLAAARSRGRLPKVVVPVHFAGQPCDMEAIAALAGQFGFRVVEDAAHAIGAAYGKHKVGACAHSDIAVFSFHAVKVITTGEGGVVLARDPEVAARVRRLHSHGLVRDRASIGQAWQGPWYYEQSELGFNYRMTDLQAALGTSQLARIESFIARRHAIADRYDRELEGLPLILPVRLSDRLSALHLYVVQVDDARARTDRRSAFEALRAAGIWVQVHYIPVHMQPYYRALGYRAGDFPVAERYYANAFSLPMHTALTDDEQSFVIDRLRRIFA
jgi:UDP-4-amino-4,6-dideoxy-N-acetyl-beta-L-altrosamine transaminase